MYVLVKDGAVVSSPYSVAQLRADNPQTSFPATPPDAVLAEFSVFPCAQTPQPAITYTQNAAQSFEQINGAWAQTWVITDASADEITQRTADESAQVRNKRNALLAASDWTQVADAPVEQTPWAGYRQALRDVTAQAGFPWEIVWPLPPN